MKPRERKRKRCLKCGQELCHSAYNHHLSTVVCPPRMSSSNEKRTRTPDDSSIPPSVQPGGAIGYQSYTSSQPYNDAEDDATSTEQNSEHGSGSELGEQQTDIGISDSFVESSESEAEVIVSEKEEMSFFDDSEHSSGSQPDIQQQMYFKKLSLTSVCF